MMILLFLLSMMVVGFAIYFLAKPKEVENIAQPTEKPKVPVRPPLTDAEREAIRQAEAVWDYKTAKEIYHGEYSGTLPEHIVGNYWTNLYPDIYHTTIAGINFRKGIKDLAGITFDATLIAEPNNKYDPNAIKIVSYDGRHLGYIPADETEAVRKFLSGSLPHPCRVHIDEDEEEVYNEDTDRFRTRHYLVGSVNICRENNQEKTNE